MSTAVLAGVKVENNENNGESNHENNCGGTQPLKHVKRTPCGPLVNQSEVEAGKQGEEEEALLLVTPARPIPMPSSH